MQSLKAQPLACWVIFHAFVIVCRLLSKLTFLKKKIFQEQRHLNCLDPDQDLHSARSDLDPNCLPGYQEMTKVATSEERVNSTYLMFESKEYPMRSTSDRYP